MNDDKATAYPLAWPPGWRRTSAHQRARAKFGTTPGGESILRHSRRELTIAQAVERVLAELQRLGVQPADVVISTNVRPTLAGLPRAGERQPDDPGVAVYWRRQHRGEQRRCMAIDRYTTVAGNLGAIAATLDAMRAIERHGGAEILDRAFTGFAALPAPEQPFQVLGVGANATTAEIEHAYKRLASLHHPDKAGADPDLMARINVARDQLLADRS